MTDWYYAEGQHPKGPIGEEELHDLINSGHITRDTRVWREEMDDWQKAGEHPDLSSAFPYPPSVPDTPTEKDLSSVSEPSHSEPDIAIISRPWPRFLARLIDNFIFAPMLGLGIALWAVVYYPNLYLKILTMHSGLYGLMMLPLVSLVLSLCMMVTGSTPGKAILGVRVPVAPSQSRIGFFLEREFKVWLAGLGAGIPLVALFTQTYQYRRLAAGKPAFYDEGNPAVTANPSTGRMITGLVVVALLVAGNIMLRAEDDKVERALNSTQTWINPLTNKKATIGSTWQAQEMESESGKAFYFASDELLLEAFFGHEQFDFDGLDTKTYGDAIKALYIKEITIETEWNPISIRGMSALKATGKNIESPDAPVEMIVMVRGRDAWRALISSRGHSSEQAAEKDKFIQAVFGSAN